MWRAANVLVLGSLAACASADSSGGGGDQRGTAGGVAAGAGVAGGGGAAAIGAAGGGGALAGSGGAIGSSGAAGASGSGAVGSGGAGSGGAAGGGGSSGAGAGGAAGGGVPSGDPLLDRLSASTVTAPAGVKAGGRNFRIWGSTNLRTAPVFTVPLASCETLICYTSGTQSSANARAVRLGADDALAESFDLGAGLECRGLAAEPDGHFGALLWNGATDQIWVKRYDPSGAEVSSTELVNAENHPTDFGLGEARLEYGDGRYGAYYHVHSDSGHEGDTLKFVTAATGVEDTQWDWGCSHSMSNLLTFNPSTSTFLPTCVTDCYPGTAGSDFATSAIGGIYVDNRRKVLDVAAGCNGDVAGELGGAAVAPDGWKLVFNGHVGPVQLGTDGYDENTMNQDIAFASISADRMPMGAVVWLTETASVNEADSAMARWQPAGDAAEQYVVGWLEPTPAAVYKLARVDPDGAVLEGPIDVTAKAHWGQRDDPFRAHVNGDVVWAWFEAAGSTDLHFARLRSDGSAQCASF